MSKWSELYEKEIKEVDVGEYIKDKLATKSTIIKFVKKYTGQGKVMEVGSGTGVLSLKIATLGYDVIALDSDQDMIDLSKKYILPEFDKVKIEYINADIRDYKADNPIDVIYSIGVLEHYNDDEIIDLLNKQLSMSKFVIFGIPTKYFDEDKKMYGNERYLTIRYWKKLIEKSKGNLIDEGHYHYLNWIQRIFKISKYFKPYPVHLFVLNSEDKSNIM